MGYSHVLNSQQSSARGRGAARDVCTLAAGSVHSLRPRNAMALRVAQGQAWVTFDDGPHGLGGEAAGDLFLHAGQTLWVALGRHAVIESVGAVPLQYRLSNAERPRAARHWWQRAQMGPCGDEVCCA
jgi:hypothetical protein